MQTQKKKESPIISVFFIVGLFLFFIFPVIIFFWLKPISIYGSSMNPQYLQGEYYLSDRLIYFFSQPKRGEVIIYSHPSNTGMVIISRVIGLPGETIEMRNKDVFINNVMIQEPYLQEQNSTEPLSTQYSFVLKENEYFVLGDNRKQSADSRKTGPILKSQIKGKVQFKYWPLKK